MKKYIFYHWLLIFHIICSHQILRTEEPPPLQEPKGYWVVNVPTFGGIFLHFKESRGLRCHMQWEIEDRYYPVVRSGDHWVLMDRLKGDRPLLAFTIDPDTGAPVFLEGHSIQEQDRIILQEIPLITNEERRKKKTSKVDLKGNELRQTVESLLHVAAGIYLDDRHELPEVIQHPGISPRTLSYLADIHLKEDGSEHIRFQLLDNPKLPKDWVEPLFMASQSPGVWSQAIKVSDQPLKLTEYYKERVKSGGERIRSAAAKDIDCPSELLTWLVQHAEKSHVRGSAYQNPNLPEEVMWSFANDREARKNLYGFRDPIEELLAQNIAASPRVLKSLSNSDRFKTLYYVRKNPNVSKEVALDVITRMLNYPLDSWLWYDTLLDERLTPAHIDFALDLQDQKFRATLARNDSLTLSDLKVLSRDPYKVVASTARSRMKRRFPQEAESFLSDLRPLAELNPAEDKEDEFRRAIREQDTPAAKASATYLLANGFSSRDQSRSLLSVIKLNDQKTLESLLAIGFEMPPFTQVIYGGYLSEKWYTYYKENHLLESVSDFDLLKAAVRRPKSDELLLLLKLGIDVNTTSEEGSYTILHILAESPRHDMIAVVLEKGGDPRAKTSQGALPVDFAKKISWIPSIVLLDVDGKYEKFLAEFRKQFPTQEGSPLLGYWNNQKDSFGEAALLFQENSMGYIGTGVMAGHFAWRVREGNILEMCPFDRSGVSLKNVKQVRFMIKEGVLELTSEKDGEVEITRFYRE